MFGIPSHLLSDEQVDMVLKAVCEEVDTEPLLDFLKRLDFCVKSCEDSIANGGDCGEELELVTHLRNAYRKNLIEAGIQYETPG